MQKFFRLAAVLIALSGYCSSSQAEDATAIASSAIAIETPVAVPAEVFYKTSGQAWGAAIGGLAGAAVASGQDSDPNHRLAAYLKEHGTKVGQIYADAMRAQLEQAQRFLSLADATHKKLRLTVLEYGMYATPSALFGGKPGLMMKVKAELLDPAGTILWSKDTHSSIKLGSVYDVEEYLADTARIDEVFRNGCNDIAMRLLRDLNKVYPASAAN